MRAYDIPIGSKLGVPKWLFTHVGTYHGNNMVFQNSPENGAEIVSMEKFSGGRSIQVRSGGVVDIPGYYLRVRQILAEQRPYDSMANNCEHTASFVRSGVPCSPQLQISVGLAIIAGLVLWNRY